MEVLNNKTFESFYIGLSQKGEFKARARIYIHYLSKIDVLYKPSDLHLSFIYTRHFSRVQRHFPFHTCVGTQRDEGREAETKTEREAQIESEEQTDSSQIEK